MTLERLKEIFAERDDNYLDWKSLTIPRTTSREDLDAFLLLDKLVPSKPIDHMPGHRHDIVTCAEHDKIWLDVDLELLAQAASEEDILNLCRLGVMLDSDVDSLSMYV